MKAMFSERRLAWMLGVPLARLRDIANHAGSHYREWKTYNKSRTKVRTIRSPDAELKAIQRNISSRILGVDDIGPDVHGGVPGRSPRTNAAQHIGCDCLVTLDVRSFFPSVRHEMVFRMFREFGCGTGVARLLTQLTTIQGALPQGAPTSVPIANLLLAMPVDQPTGAQARTTGVVYTRFVDDVGMSGDRPQTMISDVARRLSERGLKIYRGRHDEKLKIRRRSEPQEITGILINSGRLTLPRRHRDKVRAAIHELPGLADHAKRDAALRSIRGRIAHVNRFQPAIARRLEAQLARVMGC
jgi:hypothetical protein